jgi:hypothetical protein
MNISYMIYQAERQPSIVEQRETDKQTGELASAVAEASRALKAAVIRYAGGKRPQSPVVPGDDLIPVGCVRR